ncbi:Rab family GTPase [Histomonas meleagridis]|uniref:Rab family GTPase n=1 Tax=Histomonas meleagridis TaxID=135588 RepID=UPI0035593A88|nr:Rab family GTPase [Histomonas meleagridis]KAH0803639.1 Rab family GTPase [Histomonas meleagridis]
MNGSNAIKVILLGSTSVGKTTLLTRWCDDYFDPNKLSTLGAGTRFQNIEIDNENYTFQVWDTAGQDSFRDTVPLYCKGAKAAMIVFDLTVKSSFEDVPEWINLFKNLEPDSPFVLVGNKSDLMEKREISIESVTDFAEKNNCKYYETSAFSGVGVDDAFGALATEAIQAMNTVADENPPNIVSIGDTTSQNNSSGCC